MVLFLMLCVAKITSIKSVAKMIDISGKEWYNRCIKNNLRYFKYMRCAYDIRLLQNKYKKAEY